MFLHKIIYCGYLLEHICILSELSMSFLCNQYTTVIIKTKDVILFCFSTCWVILKDNHSEMSWRHRCQHWFPWQHSRGRWECCFMFTKSYACVVILTLRAPKKQTTKLRLQKLFFFFFLFSLTSLSRLFHSYRDEPIRRWGENGSTPGKTTWHTRR